MLARKARVFWLGEMGGSKPGYGGALLGSIVPWACGVLVEAGLGGPASALFRRGMSALILPAALRRDGFWK
jgi:hypothetical protein